MGKLPRPPNGQIFDLKMLLFEKMNILWKMRFYHPLPPLKKEEKITEFLNILPLLESFVSTPVLYYSLATYSLLKISAPPILLSGFPLE